MGADEYIDTVRSIRLDLLEMIGSGYVVEHCVSAFRKETELRRWMTYVADGVKLVTENTAARVGGNMLAKAYSELIAKKEPEKTGDEIVKEIITRAGLKVQDERI